MNIMIKRQFFSGCPSFKQNNPSSWGEPQAETGEGKAKTSSWDHAVWIYMWCNCMSLGHGESSSPTSRVLPSQPWNKGLFSPAAVLRPQACDTQSPGCCLSRGRTTLQVGTKEWLIPSTWYRVLNIPQKLWVSSFTYLEPSSCFFLNH